MTNYNRWNKIMHRFDIISSVYHHASTGTMEVDVPAKGVDEILTSLMDTGVDASTSNAIILGEY